MVHRRKGTILAYNGIEFSEGPWAGKAYSDASELARRRAASREVNYGWTRPGVISQGPIGASMSGTVGCATGDCGVPSEVILPAIPNSAPMEEVTPSLEAPENALPSLSDQTNSRPSARPISEAIVQVGYSEPLRGNQPPKAPAMPEPARDATTM